MNKQYENTIIMEFRGDLGKIGENYRYQNLKMYVRFVVIRRKSKTEIMDLCDKNLQV